MDAGAQAWHKGPMERIDAARDAAVRRRAELDRRIHELHERNRQLTTSLIDGPADTHGGSSPEQVRRAEELARLAGDRAAEAARRAAAMYLHAATAHERAARMYTMLAEAGTANAGEHRERAREHLRLAAADRASAEAIAARQGPGG